MLGAGAAEGGSVWALLVYVASGALALGYMVPILTASLRDGDQPARTGAESDPRMLWPIVIVAVLSVVFGVTAGMPGSPAHWAITALAPSFGGWTP
jgi:formate hydrogenlyase subunit 3/multisubunit Na+/H+ antiporter MnhD subunit